MKMRKFGTDKPDLMKFQIGDSDKVYTIPLAASMPASVLIKMSELAENDAEAFKFQFELLKKYMGDAADELTATEVRDIIDAWYEESGKNGADPGES